MDYYDVYIVHVHPADGYGEDYFYCYRILDNARAKIAELADKFGLYLHNSDFAARYDSFDKEHKIKEIRLSEEWFED